MTASPSSLERDALDEVAQRLSDQGYVVHRDPRGADAPTFLKGFQADVIATRGDEHLLIEVMSQNRSAAAEAAKIEQLRSLVADQPGWRLEVVYARPSSVLPAVAGVDAIQARLAEVRSLVRSDPDAGLVMGWALLEAVVRVLFPERAGRALTPGTAVELLASLGYVTYDQANHLRAAGQARNLVVHGDLEGRASTAQTEDLFLILDGLVAQAAEKQRSTGAQSDQF